MYQPKIFQKNKAWLKNKRDEWILWNIFPKFVMLLGLWIIQAKTICQF